MRGASRESRDKKGKRPLDLTANIKCESLQTELRASLEEDSRCEFLMLKASLKKTEKSIKMPIAFLVFFDSVYVVLILFLFPSKYIIHANQIALKYIFRHYESTNLCYFRMIINLFFYLVWD